MNKPSLSKTAGSESKLPVTASIATSSKKTLATGSNPAYKEDTVEYQQKNTPASFTSEYEYMSTEDEQHRLNKIYELLLGDITSELLMESNNE